MIRSPRNELITAAACQLIASSITLKEMLLEGQSSVPHWRTIVDLGLKHRKSTVQVAAASALAKVSKLVDCSAVVQRYVDISPSWSSKWRLILRLYVHQGLQVGFAHNAAKSCTSSGSDGLQEPFTCTYRSRRLPCCIYLALGMVTDSALVPHTKSDHFHQSEWRMSDVEARRNCVESIRLVLTALVPHPSRSMRTIYGLQPHASLIYFFRTNLRSRCPDV